MLAAPTSLLHLTKSLKLSSSREAIEGRRIVCCLSIFAFTILTQNNGGKLFIIIERIKLLSKRTGILEAKLRDAGKLCFPSVHPFRRAEALRIRRILACRNRCSEHLCKKVTKSLQKRT